MLERREIVLPRRSSMLPRRSSMLPRRESDPFDDAGSMPPSCPASSSSWRREADAMQRSHRRELAVAPVGRGANYAPL
jgi:hypothetical protein